MAQSKWEKGFKIFMVAGVILAILGDYYFDHSRDHLSVRYRHIRWLSYFGWTVGLLLACGAFLALVWPSKKDHTLTIGTSTLTFTEDGVETVIPYENVPTTEYDKIIHISKAGLMFKEESRLRRLIAKELSGQRILWK